MSEKEVKQVVDESMKQDIEQFNKVCNNIFEQVSRDVVGMKEVVEGTIIAMIAGGNVLLEGVPGVGKTRLVRTLGRVFDLPFSRIQFTPDLMPADVTGTNIIKTNPATRYSSSRKDLSLQTSSSRTKSTVLRLRRSQRYWKRCRSTA